MTGVPEGLGPITDVEVQAELARIHADYDPAKAAETFRAINAPLPRTKTGEIDVQAASRLYDRQELEAMGPDGYDLVLQGDELRAAGIPESDLPEDILAARAKYRDEVLPSLLGKAERQADLEREARGQGLQWGGPLAGVIHQGTKNLWQVGGPVLTGTAQVAADLLYGGTALAGGNTKDLNRNLATGELESVLGGATPDVGVWVEAFARSLAGEDDPMASLYQDVARGREARRESSDTLGVAETIGRTVGDIRAMFGVGALRHAFGTLGEKATAAAAKVSAKHGGIAGGLAWLGAQTALPGALYGGLGAVRSAADPETGEAQKAGDILGHAAVEAMLFPVFAGLSHVASKAAASALKPTEKQVAEAVTKYAKANSEMWPDLGQGRFVPKDLGTYREFWGGEWIKAGMPGYKPSSAQVTKSLAYQSLLEGAGFAALDAEIWADALDGDGFDFGRLAEGVLTNALAMGVYAGKGRIQDYYRSQKENFPPLGARVAMPGVEASVMADMPAEQPKPLPDDILAMGWRQRADGSYARDVRPDLAIEGATPNERLAQRLPEAADPLDAIRHYTLRDLLEGRRRLQGVGEDILVDGHKAVTAPDGSTLYAYRDGNVYSRPVSGDGIWRRADGVRGPEAAIDPSQFAAVDSFAKTLLETPMTPAARETAAEMMRTMLAVPRSMDPGVDAALRMVEPSPDLGVSVLEYVTKAMPPGESQVKATERTIMEIAATAAGLKAEAKTVEDIILAHQEATAAAGLGVGEGASGPRPKPQEELNLGDQVPVDQSAQLGVGDGSRGPRPKPQGELDLGDKPPRTPEEPAAVEAGVDAAAEGPRAGTVTEGVKALREKAKGLGVPGTSKMKLGDLKSAIAEAERNKAADAAAAPTAGKAPAPTEFATKVHAAAAATPSYGKYSTGGAFISELWEGMGRPGSLPEFKKQLFDAAQRGEIRMTRADLVEAMPPDVVKASELKTSLATFHMVNVPGAKIAGAVPKDALRFMPTLGDGPAVQAAKKLPLVVGRVADVLTRVMRPYYNPVVMEVRNHGDKAAGAEISERGLRATYKANKLEGQWSKQRQGVKNLTRRTTKASRAATGELDSPYDPLSNTQVITSKQLAHGDGHADVPLSGGAREVMDRVQALSYAQGRAMMAAGGWIKLRGGSAAAPFEALPTDRRLVTLFTDYGSAMADNPNGAVAKAYAEGTAKLKPNADAGVTPQDVLKTLSADSRRGSDNHGHLATEGMDAREMARSIPLLPDFVVVDGVAHRVRETRPYEYADTASRRAADRISYIEEFGQRLPKTLVEAHLKKHPGARPPKEHADELFKTYVEGGPDRPAAERWLTKTTRALNGMPLDGPLGDPSSGASWFMRNVHDPVVGSWVHSKLSGVGTALVNIPEPLGQLAQNVGYRNVVGAMADYWGAAVKSAAGNKTRLKEILEEARTYNADIADKLRLPSFKSGDRVDAAKEVASWMSTLQRLINSGNEVISILAAGRWRAQVARDGVQPVDVENLRAMQLPKDTLDRLSAGKGTADDWGMVIAKMPAWTQGTGRAAELSAIQQNRQVRMFLKFQTYLRNAIRNQFRLGAEFRDMWVAAARGDTATAQAKEKILARALTGKAVFAGSMLAMVSAVRYGLSAIGLIEGDDAEAWGENVSDQFVNALWANEVFTPFGAALGRGSDGQTIAEGLVESIPQYDILKSIEEAAPFAFLGQKPKGEYTNEDAFDRFVKLARRQIPLVNDFMRYTDGPADLRMATKRYYDFLREKEKETGLPRFSGGGNRFGVDEFTATMRDFRDAFKRAGADGKTMSRDDLKETLREAMKLGKHGRDSVASSLSSHKLLTELSRDERDELRKRIGSDQYKILREHDRAVDRWINWVR